MPTEELEEEWPPRELRFRGPLWRGESHLARAEFFKATLAFGEAAGAASAGERELARGLLHLAAAGYKRQDGDERGAARQLAHARRRLGPFLPAAHELDLVALIDEVERFRPG